MDFAEQITRKESRIGIIGLGYVGLPLATDHTPYDYAQDVIVENARPVDDTRNLVRNLNGNVYKAV